MLIKLFKTFFKTSLLTVLFLLPALSAADTDSGAAALSSHLQYLKSFEADFSQTIKDKNNVTLQQSQGKMALKRPGLFKWQTQTPNQQLIIADGKTVWIYDKDLQQINKHPQNKAANTPGILLSDSVNQFIERFKINMLDKNTFKLTPINNKKELFQSVILKFTHNSLTQMILADNLGQTTVINFSQIKINPDLSARTFTFAAPKNIPVTE